jgi:hypothetical protein
MESGVDEEACAGNCRAAEVGLCEARGKLPLPGGISDSVDPGPARGNSAPLVTP